MSIACASTQALYCVECVCLTWYSILGLGIPTLLVLLYVPRVFKEATADDWVILAFATIFTYASRTAVPGGVSHAPWYLYLVTLWAMNACWTDRVAALRSIPLVGVFTFLSVCCADVASMVTERPEGAIGIPGGRGLLDGLVLKPLAAIGVTYLAYALKVKPIRLFAARRRTMYDASSVAFLFNVRPSYRRADLEGRLPAFNDAAVKRP